MRRTVAGLPVSIWVLLAFIASLLIGLVQTFAVSINVSLADVLGVLGVTASPTGTLGDIWRVTVAQIAPIIPYILLILILIFRPRGLLGEVVRERA